MRTTTVCSVGIFCAYFATWVWMPGHVVAAPGSGGEISSAYCQSAWTPYAPGPQTSASHTAHTPIWPSWSGVVCNGAKEVGTIQMHVVSDAQAARSGTWNATVSDGSQTMHSYGYLSDFETHQTAGMTLVMSSGNRCRLSLLQVPYRFGDMAFRITESEYCGVAWWSTDELLFVMWREH